jgi:FixJ family two-component response regulator
MSWVTFIWSMTAGICLTFGAVHFLVWARRRDQWANLVFSITAAAAAGYAVLDVVALRQATHFRMKPLATPHPPPGTVFLLDDEPGMLKALTRLLAAEGFNVRAFTSAKAFLESYHPEALSCLVLDVAMPELNGLELQQRLTRAGILLPIVFLTGRGDIPMTVQAIQAGAVDFLTKPVKDVDLLHAVRVALQRAAEPRELIKEMALLRQRYSASHSANAR